MDSKRISDLVDHFQRQGRYSFARAELEALAKASRPAVAKALKRLEQKNRINRIRRGFYAIVPVEYSSIGMIPADWFIDDLMRYLGLAYYVGLQTAASYHGAAHQRVQEFQVVTSVQEQPIRQEALAIRFFRKRSLESTQLQAIKGHSGMLPVSSPEATALDLVRYANRIGGLSAVGTILVELCESFDSDRLKEAARAESDLAPVQRVGWLLDWIGKASHADALRQTLSPGVLLPRAKLDPSGNWKGHPLENRWCVAENTELEFDV